MFVWRQHLGWGELLAGVFVFVHDKVNPTDFDWSACMADLEMFAERQKPIAIVFTDGGAPTGSQRVTLNRLVGKSPPTAVVSDAIVTRFVVSSLALMNPSIASFSAVEIDKAWKHVGLPQEEIALATSELSREARALTSNFRTLRRALRMPE